MSVNPWKVTHYDHGGNALGEVKPNGLHFDLHLNLPGDIQYEIDLSHSLATKSNCRAYYTDYVLTRGTRNIQAGIHTGIQIDDVMDRVLQVSGLDWLHYFEGCFWPFDPTNPTGGLYLQTGRDIALIVKDLFDTILAQTNRLSVAYSLSAIGQTTDYKIDVADTTNLLDRISTLSKLVPGFDYDMSPDLTRTFTLYSGQKGNATSPFVFEQGVNLFVSTYGNTGPAGTHMLGLATSASGGQLGTVIDSVIQPSTRRWDIEEQFDNVQDATQLASLAAGQAVRDATDRIAFTAKYVPRDSEDFWGEVGIGDTCQCIIPLANYDTINDYYRIVGISCDVTDEGSEEISLTFDYGTLSL